MKSFPQILIVICVVLLHASAADLELSVKSKVESETQSKARRLEDDKLWDVGTAEFGNDTYIVTLGEDDEEVENIPIMDQMAEHASEDGKQWNVGTQVYNEPSGEGGLSGTITSFNSTKRLYRVTWEDGTTVYYDDTDGEVNQMVAWAKGNPENSPADSGSSNQIKYSGPLDDTLGNEELILDPDEENEIEPGENDESVDFYDNLMNEVEIEFDDEFDGEFDDDLGFLSDEDEDESEDIIYDDFDIGFDDDFSTDDDDDIGFLSDEDEDESEDIYDDFDISFDDDYSTDSFFARDDWWQIGGSSVVFFGLIFVSVCLLGTAFGYKIYARRRDDTDTYSLSNTTDGFTKIHMY